MQSMLRPLFLLWALSAPLALAAESATVLVTDANRGIGLEFVRQYAERGWDVIATARKPAEATELEALAKQRPAIRVESLDLASGESIAALAALLKGRPIDVLINNAGLLGDVPNQTIGGRDQREFQYVMSVNTFGALKLSELTARRGGFYAYRMSKAALNIGFRSLAADWRGEGLMVGIIVPGMVETQLLRESGFRGRGMLKVIDGMTLENNDKAINYDGTVIPW